MGSPQRIAIIGNCGGGKSVLSRRLAERYDLPLTFVDAVRLLPFWRRRPLDEVHRILAEVEATDRWIIDGFGPDACIMQRFARADAIVFIDFPLWRHFWWVTKRQLQGIGRGPRPELPAGCRERSLGYTVHLYRSLLHIHLRRRRKLLAEAARHPRALRLVRDVASYRRILRAGL